MIDYQEITNCFTQIYNSVLVNKTKDEAKKMFDITSELMSDLDVYISNFWPKINDFSADWDYEITWQLGAAAVDIDRHNKAGGIELSSYDIPAIVFSTLCEGMVCGMLSILNKLCKGQLKDRLKLINVNRNEIDFVLTLPKYLVLRFNVEETVASMQNIGFLASDAVMYQDIQQLLPASWACPIPVVSISNNGITWQSILGTNLKEIYKRLIEYFN